MLLAEPATTTTTTTTKNHNKTIDNHHSPVLDKITRSQVELCEVIPLSSLDQPRLCTLILCLEFSVLRVPSKVNRGPLSPLADPIGYLYLILLDRTACRLRYPIRSHLTQEFTYFVDSSHAV